LAECVCDDTRAAEVIGRCEVDRRRGRKLGRVFGNELSGRVNEDGGFGACDLLDTFSLAVVEVLTDRVSVGVIYRDLFVVAVKDK